MVVRRLDLRSRILRVERWEMFWDVLVESRTRMERKKVDFYLGDLVFAEPELFEAFEVFEVLYLLPRS